MQQKPDLFDLDDALASMKKKAAKKVVRESVVEAAHMQGVKAAGGISFKFVSPARRSVPDRLDLMPIPEAVRHVVAQYVRFTECKRPGEVPTPSQHREHERLRALGYTVDIVDSLPTRKPK